MGTDATIFLTVFLTGYCLIIALVILYVRHSNRRRWRRERGECPECGYDMRGSGDTCPECGAERVI